VLLLAAIKPARYSQAQAAALGQLRLDVLQKPFKDKVYFAYGLSKDG
jgi:hypothetical protein